jgi:hypothetical protein
MIPRSLLHRERESGKAKEDWIPAFAGTGSIQRE